MRIAIAKARDWAEGNRLGAGGRVHGGKYEENIQYVKI